jgi:hypothetical protein
MRIDIRFKTNSWGDINVGTYENNVGHRLLTLLYAVYNISPCERRLGPHNHDRFFSRAECGKWLVYGMAGSGIQVVLFR